MASKRTTRVGVTPTRSTQAPPTATTRVIDKPRQSFSDLSPEVLGVLKNQFYSAGEDRKEFFKDIEDPRTSTDVKAGGNPFPTGQSDNLTLGGRPEAPAARAPRDELKLTGGGSAGADLTEFGTGGEYDSEGFSTGIVNPFATGQVDDQGRPVGLQENGTFIEGYEAAGLGETKTITTDLQTYVNQTYFKDESPGYAPLETSEEWRDYYNGIQGFSEDPSDEQIEWLKQRDEFLTTLGDYQDTIKNLLISVEQQNGQAVDTTDPKLQQNIQEAIASGASEEDINAILGSYLMPAPGAHAVQPGKSVPEIIEGLIAEVRSNTILPQVLLDDAVDKWRAGTLSDQELIDYLSMFSPQGVTDDLEEGATFDTELTYTAPPEVELIQYLNEAPGMTFDELVTRYTEYLKDPENLSTYTSAQLNQLYLGGIALTSTLDFKEKMQDYWAAVSTRATETYDTAIEHASTAEEELDDIINGLITDYSQLETVEGKQVFLAQMIQERGIEGVEATQDLTQLNFDFEYDRMLDQNAKLESYMKAKLNYIGAIDSSSGLSLMNTVFDNAATRIMLFVGQNNNTLTNLELQKRQFMIDYYTAATDQFAIIKTDKDDAITTYNDKMDAIDLNEILSDQEADTAMLSALSDYTSNIYSVETDQKAFEYQMSLDFYDRALAAAELGETIESTAKEEAAAKLETLLSLYAGQDWNNLGSKEKEMIVGITDFLGLPQSFGQDSLQAILDAGPDRDWDIKYITDDYGNVYQVLFDKNTGETVSQLLGPMGAGNSNLFGSLGGGGGGGGAPGTALEGTNFDADGNFVHNNTYDTVIGMYATYAEGVMAEDGTPMTYFEFISGSNDSEGGLSELEAKSLLGSSTTDLPENVNKSVDYYMDLQMTAPDYGEMTDVTEGTEILSSSDGIVPLVEDIISGTGLGDKILDIIPGVEEMKDLGEVLGSIPDVIKGGVRALDL